jgi:beta-N-acetylhexosaminidase
VETGALSEDRLAEAASRVRRLAGWTAAKRAEARYGGNGHNGNGHNGTPVGLAAARRAVRVFASSAPFRPLASAPHVVEFAPTRNIAIGAETPWGLAEPLAGLLPGTTTVRVDADAMADGSRLAAELCAAVGRPLVLVVRDVHRHRWMAQAVDRVRVARPDAVVVEMGVPAAAAGQVHLATYGATRANAQAAAELLVGR